MSHHGSQTEAIQASKKKPTDILECNKCLTLFTTKTKPTQGIDFVAIEARSSDAHCWATIKGELIRQRRVIVGLRLHAFKQGTLFAAKKERQSFDAALKYAL